MPTSVGLALVLLAANVDVEGGATIELRRGSAPISPVDPPHAATVSVVTPEAGALLSDSNGQLKLRYFPALTGARLDGQHGDNKLYVLHQADLTAFLHSGRRLSWILRATGATGDTDYTALVQLLGRTQVQLPTVTGFTTATAVLGANVALDRLSRVETSLNLLHRAPLGQLRADPLRFYPDCPPPAPLPGPSGTPPPAADAMPPPPSRAPPPPISRSPPAPIAAPNTVRFPTENTVTVTPNLIHDLSARDTVDARTGLGSLWLSTGLQLLSVAPHVGWRHLVTRDSSFRAGVGLVYTDLVSRPPTACGVAAQDLPQTTLSPVADAAVSTVFYERHDLSLAANVNTAATWYFDPVLARSLAIGGAGVQIAAIFPPKLSVRLDVYFSTSLRSHPLDGNPDETIFTSVLPIRYQVSPDVYVEVGGRWSDRAPHLKAQAFEFHRREMWIYATVSGTFGSVRTPPPGGFSGAAPGAAPAAVPPPSNRVTADEFDAASSNDSTLDARVIQEPEEVPAAARPRAPMTPR